MSKLLDYENFEVELGQSPLLTAFAGWVGWIVPTIELIIALCLIFPRLRLAALFASFSLMVMFTVYIIIILNYSSFIPCSCGGILEKLSWQEHLMFNIVFVILAMAAILFELPRLPQKPIYKKALLTLSGIMLLSSGAVILLYNISEEIVHRNNPFIRRYPHHPATMISESELKYNSYYFAGQNDGVIYLANYTAPLHMLAVDSTLKVIDTINIGFDDEQVAFQRPKISVAAPYFYIYDGTVPYVAKGRISDWRVASNVTGNAYFNLFAPVDSTRFAFRANNKSDASNVLGIQSLRRDAKAHLNPGLLEKQVDGIFDTDGMLLSSPNRNKVIYLYNYRNEYIIADANAQLLHKGHTIDTITHASIKVAQLKKGTDRRMSTPPLVVNASAAAHGNLLFVNSLVPGKYEQLKVWKQASVIDIYNVVDRTYLFSFHVYGINGKKLKSFIVTPTHLFALIDTKIVSYRFDSIVSRELK